ncbi:actinin-like protein [Trametes sanguinea]|nr:actinin-like protein [Trametes sanguinea]
MDNFNPNRASWGGGLLSPLSPTFIESLEARSRDVQERTFCKWLNTKLEANGYPPMTSLVKDLSDGVRLIQLMASDTSLGRYNKNPKMRVQKAENVNKALEFITSRGVKLTNIGPEGAYMIGSFIHQLGQATTATRYTEGLSAKEGLLLWCQRKTEPYKEVDVQDFSLSWSDGLALCALIHCHRPDLIDYDKLDKTDRHGNTRLAFQIAQEHLGIPQLLEVADLCDTQHPDERSVMTYVAGYFHAFSSMEQTETVSRRVEKFAELMQSVWTSRNDYERRVRELLRSMAEMRDTWAAKSFAGTYADAREHAASFQNYKQTTKRSWVTEKQDVATLFGNFADLANDFERRLRIISTELVSIEGPLEEQMDQVRELQTRVPALSDSLRVVAEAEDECRAANVDENDYTVFTVEDLRFELELLSQSITKKIAFIDNQIVSRNMTNLTPAQLEQFESTFRYFDKDESNTLNQSEMAAALASLGIVYSDEDMDLIYDQLLQDYGAVTFEAFINLLVDIMEDQTSPAQLREAFRGIAADKPYVTELDLRVAHLPANAIEFLRQAMPSSTNGVGEPEYDYERWIEEVFDSQDGL